MRLMELTDTLDELKIDNRSGWGAVPHNQNVDYRGLRVAIKPSTFLRLAHELEHPYSAKDIEQHIRSDGSIASPFLMIAIPQDWFEGDMALPAEIYGHEGRNRMMAVLNAEGDEPVETHLFFGGEIRNRHLTPEIIARLNQDVISERGSLVRGPWFTRSVIDEVTKVRISTDPNDFGAYVDDEGEPEPTVMLPLGKIKYVVEPDDLHQTKPGAPKRIARMVKAIQQGKQMPPILVRKYKDGYQVMDGHHRFKAYRIAKSDTIPARIIDPENITGDVDETFGGNNLDKAREHEQLAIVKIDGTEIRYIKNPGDAVQIAAVIENPWALYSIQNPAQALWKDTKAKDSTLRYLLGILKDVLTGDDSDIDNCTNLLERLRDMDCPWPELDDIEQSLGARADDDKTDESVIENFADGKGPGRPGDSQRHGIPKGATMAQLRKAAKAPGRKGQLARWQINMRNGRKKTNETIAPHGDPENELRMMKAGTKPAALMLDYHYDTLYKPIADKLGWEVVKFDAGDVPSYVVAQHGEKARARRIAGLVSDANKSLAAGNKLSPEYHRELGTLLGYSKADIDHFIKNIYGDIDEGVWDTISDFGQSAANTAYDIGMSAADSASAFGRSAADTLTLGGYKYARAGADYIAKQALKNIGYGSGATYDMELKQEIEKLIGDEKEHPNAVGAGRLAGVIGAAAAPEIPVIGGVAAGGYKAGEVAQKAATAYKYAKQMLGMQEGDVVHNRFAMKQAAKNKTPYVFNQDIADSIPLYDPNRRYGVAHKSPRHAHGDEIPFDSFDVNDKSERTSDIIGIIGDKRIVVATTRPDLARVLADAYNRRGFTTPDVEMVREADINPNGAALTVFDMDETLFHTKAMINVVRDGKVVHRLNNQQYNTYQLKPGEKYDYREFRDAQLFHDTSVPIERMWRKAQNLLSNIGKRPRSKVIIVTARSDLDDRETFLNTFRKHGLDIDKVHVHRAGNLPVPAAAAKKAIIATYLNTGQFDSVRLFDDAESNLRSFLQLRDDYPDIRFTAYLVLPGGHVAKYES